VDHPAVVVLEKNTNESGPNAPGKPLTIEKILIPLKIPVLARNSGQIEFVKKNGDRVFMDIRQLKGRYDLILFNAENDPLLCGLNDLESAASHYFLGRTPGKFPSNAGPESSKAMLTLPDTGNTRGYRLDPSFRQGRARTAMIMRADTDTSPLVTRNIPGVCWVESRVDTRKSLIITFENDLITYYNTDRYFTNGITVGLQAPWIANMRVSRLLLPYRKPATVAYSAILVQNMYTPTDTRYAPTLSKDRPYASYLYLGFKKLVRDPGRKLRLTSEIDLGFTGPYSPGSYLQTLVHKTFPTNDKPLGWETQIKTDIIANYSVTLDKAIIDGSNVMLSASVSMKAGTLYNQAGTGFRLQLGRHEPYFKSHTATEKDPWQYFFFLDARTTLVAYDATLQGGILNRENVFTLGEHEVSRCVGYAEAGLQATYKGYGIEVAQHFLTPEYKGGMGHRWGRISVLMKL